MFENIMRFFRKMTKKDNKDLNSKEQAKERLHLVLMQDRANVSADFLDLMRQEIIDVIKKYIEVDESAIDVRLTNKDNGDGTMGAPALYANIPITKIKEEMKKQNLEDDKENKNVNNEEIKEQKVKDKSEKENFSEGKKVKKDKSVIENNDNKDELTEKLAEDQMKEEFANGEKLSNEEADTKVNKIEKNTESIESN